MPHENIEARVQSLVFTGFGSLPHTALLRLRDIESAWLARLLPRVSFGRARHEVGVQVLFTAQGLAALGASPEHIAALGREVRNGMTSTPSRQRIGDVGPLAPDESWWTDLDHDALLLVYGRSAEHLAELLPELIEGVTVAGDVDLRLPEGGREPFGFLDGITSLRLARPGQSDPAAPPDGELLLGHRDASGAIRDPGPLGQHGSLVVVRQLAQDVESFWSFWIQAAGSDAALAIQLASKALGRWPNGMPVKPGEVYEPPADAGKRRWTSFADDGHGTGCPFGSHVRRASPRDTLVADAQVSRQIAALHTLLRRGRVFGPPAPSAWYPDRLRPHMPPAEPGHGSGERGLMFIGLCTDIRRQFEFIMQNWLMGPKHAGLFNEVDPVLAHEETSRTFTIPTEGFSQHLQGVGGWVRPGGGGYYLLPARDALAALTSTALFPSRDTP